MAEPPSAWSPESPCGGQIPCMTCEAGGGGRAFPIARARDPGAAYHRISPDLSRLAHRPPNCSLEKVVTESRTTPQATRACPGDKTQGCVHVLGGWPFISWPAAWLSAAMSVGGSSPRQRGHLTSGQPRSSSA